MKASRFNALFAVFLWLAGAIALAAPADVEQVTLARFPGGDNEARAMATQPDGKVVTAGVARIGTKRFAVMRHHADGGPDLAFGVDGTAIVAVGPEDSEANAVAVQPDGRILVAGSSRRGSGPQVMALVRLLADGTPDPAFGTQGIVTLQVGTFSAIQAVALQPDGKIVIAGFTGSERSTFTVGRFLSDGGIDTSFAGAGLFIAAPSANSTLAHALALQPDGRIVAVGEDRGFGVQMHRLNADGSVDSSWATTALSGMRVGRAVLLQPDGKVVVAGESALSATQPDAITVLRLTAEGSLDGSFNPSGTPGRSSIQVGADTHGYGVAVQADGRIVVAGHTFNSQLPRRVVLLGRFTADGTPDASFGPGGARMPALGTEDGPHALASLPDAKLLVAGFGRGAGRDALLARFTAAGDLDTSLQGTGFALRDAGALFMTPHASVLQPDGKLVMVGEAVTPELPASVPHMAAVRFAADGSVDTGFAQGGLALLPLEPGSARAVALQPDGRILVAGERELSEAGNPVRAMTVARLLPDGAMDLSLAGTGIATVAPQSQFRDERALAVAVQPDGRIVLGGWTTATLTLDSQFVRLNADGSLDAGFGNGGRVVVAVSDDFDFVADLALQPDGRIVGGGAGFVSPSATGFIAIRLLANGTLDASFGAGGIAKTAVAPSRGEASALALQPDGRILLGGYAFDGTEEHFALVRHLADGSLDASFGAGGIVTTGTEGDGRIRDIALLPDGRIAVAGGINGRSGGAPGRGILVLQYLASGQLDAAFAASPFNVNADRDTGVSIARRADGRLWVGADGSGLFALARLAGNGATGTGALAFEPGTVAFDTQSMGATSLPLAVQVTNTGGAPVTFTALQPSAQFGGSLNDCATLAPGATCTLLITFTPDPVPGMALGGTVIVSGDITVRSDAAGGPHVVNARGSAEKSLVSHYYHAVLRRLPDPQGHAFWSGEASRTVQLGANVNEAWFAMAQAFFSSAEYAAFGRDDAGFVTDLYTTFFNRAPDSAGLAHWTGQLAQGLPREVLLAAFMFSAEFTGFTQAIFGNTAVRAEIDMAMDFYRGLLARLPDDGGFAHWLGRFRGAQCQGGDAVNAEVESVSAAFAQSPEYAARARGTAQYVGDLYNAFLRRGGDLDGVRFWIGEIERGARSREDVRRAFVASPEFQARVQAVLTQGCMQ